MSAHISRMTIGQFIETTMGKICSRRGCIVDGTSFLLIKKSCLWAYDSEDEKRVERAERMAERKLAKRRKAATQETGGDKAEVSAAVRETGGSSTTEGSTAFACSDLMRAPFQPAMGLECHPLMLPVRPIKLDCPK